MMVQAIISAPSDLEGNLSKRNLRRKDVYIIGVLWETADFICTNTKCNTVFNGYGNYVSNMKKELEELKSKLFDIQNGVNR